MTLARLVTLLKGFAGILARLAPILTALADAIRTRPRGANRQR